jgi:hypothetical protein
VDCGITATSKPGMELFFKNDIEYSYAFMPKEFLNQLELYSKFE